MASFVLLVVAFLLGMLMARSGRFPVQTPSVLGGYIIHVPLPAIALLHVHSLKISPDLLGPALMPWFVFALGAALILGLLHLGKMDRATAGCLLLTAGLGNTSFVGLPMIEAYYGREALGIGMIADQAGTFMVLSTAGIFYASRLSGQGRPTPGSLAKRILLFPPFLALLVAVLLRPVEYPALATEVLGKLAASLTPVALVAVGFQVRLRDIRKHLRPLILGLGYKLALAPVLVAGAFGLFLSGGRTFQVTVFEAAMAPMITGGIVAMEHDLNPELASLMLAVGIPLSFLTAPLVWYALS